MRAGIDSLLRIFRLYYSPSQDSNYWFFGVFFPFDSFIIKFDWYLLFHKIQSILVEISWRKKTFMDYLSFISRSWFLSCGHPIFKRCAYRRIRSIWRSWKPHEPLFTSRTTATRLLLYHIICEILYEIFWNWKNLNPFSCHLLLSSTLFYSPFGIDFPIIFFFFILHRSFSFFD